MLRKMLLASALCGLGIAGPALADPAPGATWTGPYVGLNLGYGGGSIGYPFSGTTDAAGTDPITGRFHERSSGVIGGAQAGYSFETQQGVILGLETDFDGTNIVGTNDSSSTDSTGATASGGTRSRIDYLGTVRGRLGYALFDGRLAPYLTGGFAYGRVASSNSLNCSACGAGGAAVSNLTSGAAMGTGWAVGGGTDYALTNHLSMRVEYLYTELGQTPAASDVAQYAIPGGDIYNASVDAHAKTSLVRDRKSVV